MTPAWKAFEIEGERAFPYYQLSVKYQMDGEPTPGWNNEAGPGRICSNSSKMVPLFYLDVPTPETLTAAGLQFWLAVKAQVHGPNSYGPEGTPKIPNPSDVEIKIGEVMWETWIPTWFSHVTFRLDRTDTEILESFSTYVYRQLRRDDAKSLLMGAEDRWRWRGHSKEDTPPPCSCADCTKDGLVRIDH